MSRTKKNLVVVFAIIAMLILLMVVFGALFSLQTINVDYATSMNRIKEYTKKDIIEESGIKKRTNVVFANFTKNEAKLEKTFPYARFDIVRTFPNKATIYVYEREPQFRMKSESGFWHIYDENLKCIEVVAEANLKEHNNDLIPILSGVDLELCGAVGEFIDNPEFDQTISTIIDGVYGAGETKLSIMSDIIVSNNLELGYMTYEFRVGDTGTSIIVNGDKNLKVKIAKALYVYLNSVSCDPQWITRLDEVMITVTSNYDPLQNLGTISVGKKS